MARQRRPVYHRATCIGMHARFSKTQTTTEVAFRAVVLLGR
jgi:hypothetical protein